MNEEAREGGRFRWLEGEGERYITIDSPARKVDILYDFTVLWIGHGMFDIRPRYSSLGVIEVAALFVYPSVRDTHNHSCGMRRGLRGMG